jgi:hypothetical protein
MICDNSLFCPSFGGQRPLVIYLETAKLNLTSYFFQQSHRFSTMPANLAAILFSPSATIERHLCTIQRWNDFLGPQLITLVRYPTHIGAAA